MSASENTHASEGLLNAAWGFEGCGPLNCSPQSEFSHVANTMDDRHYKSSHIYINVIEVSQ